MRNEILANINDPSQLESLYRSNKSGFKRVFNSLAPELQNNTLTAFWQARLNAGAADINWGGSKDLVFVVIASLLAGCIAKVPAVFHVNEEWFFMRNVSFIVFPFIAAYFVWKNKLSAVKIGLIAGITLASLLYINLLPGDYRNDTLVLACIHLAIFLWFITGFAFGGERLGYLSFNGDLVVMTTLILIACGILTAITIGLFQLIGLDIRQFYVENIVFMGLPAAPILGTFLIRANPQLVGKVSPVIARIFSPIVLVMLVSYLIAIIYSGKDPYNDRDFLLVFNALLIGVMAIIFFSVAEMSKGNMRQSEGLILFLLSIVTIVVNGIALSAIVFRMAEYGITPNRVAVMGGNVLILINLILVTVQLYKALTKKTGINAVGNAISAYLPVYCAWVAIVTFLFPLLFSFK